jgi:hypothetical protein
MNDMSFERLIDRRFPYRDEPERKRLVDLGRSISPNAYFISLCENLETPAGVTVGRWSLPCRLATTWTTSPMTASTRSSRIGNTTASFAGG